MTLLCPGRQKSLELMRKSCYYDPDVQSYPMIVTVPGSSSPSESVSPRFFFRLPAEERRLTPIVVSLSFVGVPNILLVLFI